MSQAKAEILYRGLLYRALNPFYARDPLSGRGAALYGGRFNARGTPALYTSLSPDTAIREANQVGTLQPTMLVAYAAEIAPVFDSRDTAALAKRGLSAAALAATDWRDRARLEGVAPTQAFARTLVEDGFTGILVSSFAKGATAHDLNLVLWRWDGALSVVDDDNRLSALQEAGQAMPDRQTAPMQNGTPE